MASREATHANSWYSGSARTLTRELDAWLAQVPESLDKVGSLPVPGARVIIAPYVYSQAKIVLLKRAE
jgi:predicted class III extradiol MEMO1 family dioxygenase